MSRSTVPVPGRRGRRDDGFTLIEVCLALVILVLAVLGHMASVSASHASAQFTEERALALQTLERFVERLREDPEWETMWTRLQASSAESAGDTTLSSVSPDPALATVAATAYYSDFLVPSQLQNATFLVQVPASANGAYRELREDLNAPRYGLPWDLDGDGLIDATPRASTDPTRTTTDYRQLPVVVRVRWGGVGPGRVGTELTLSTWLRGDR